MKRVWKVRIQPVVEGTRHDFDERGEYNIGRGSGKCPPARRGMAREQRRFSGHGIKTQIFGDHCFSGGARWSTHFDAQCPGSCHAPAKSPAAEGRRFESAKTRSEIDLGGESKGN